MRLFVVRMIGRTDACQDFRLLSHLRKISVRINSQSVVCAVILALFWHASGRPAGAQKPLSAKPQQEERVLLQAANREPNNYQVVGAVGEYYLHREKWRECVLWLTKAYALSGGDAATGYDLAFALMQSGDLDGAKRQIGQVLTRADTAKLHTLSGEVEERRGNLVDAAREYHRAAELDPSESNIFDLATFLLQHKKYVGSLDDSIKFFRYGVAQYPRSSQMMVGLGVALYADTEYDEAVRVLCAAVDLDPKDRRPIQFLGRASRVSPQLAQEVDRRLRDFVQRYPENSAANYFYALGLW